MAGRIKDPEERQKWREAREAKMRAKVLGKRSRVRSGIAKRVNKDRWAAPWRREWMRKVGTDWQAKRKERKKADAEPAVKSWVSTA